MTTERFFGFFERDNFESVINKLWQIVSELSLQDGAKSPLRGDPLSSSPSTPDAKKSKVFAQGTPSPKKGTSVPSTPVKEALEAMGATIATPSPVKTARDLAEKTDAFLICLEQVLDRLDFDANLLLDNLHTKTPENILEAAKPMIVLLAYATYLKAYIEHQTKDPNAVHIKTPLQQRLMPTLLEQKENFYRDYKGIVHSVDLFDDYNSEAMHDWAQRFNDPEQKIADFSQRFVEKQGLILHVFLQIPLSEMLTILKDQLEVSEADATELGSLVAGLRHFAQSQEVNFVPSPVKVHTTELRPEVVARFVHAGLLIPVPTHCAPVPEQCPATALCDGRSVSYPLGSAPGKRGRRVELDTIGREELGDDQPVRRRLFADELADPAATPAPQPPPSALAIQPPTPQRILVIA